MQDRRPLMVDDLLWARGTLLSRRFRAGNSTGEATADADGGPSPGGGGAPTMGATGWLGWLLPVLGHGTPQLRWDEVEDGVENAVACGAGAARPPGQHAAGVRFRLVRSIVLMSLDCPKSATCMCDSGCTHD